MISTRLVVCSLLVATSVDAQPNARDISVTHHTGWCTAGHVDMVRARAGKVDDARITIEGWWSTVARLDDHTLAACLDVEGGYVTAVFPAAKLDALRPALDAIRADAYAEHGEPRMTRPGNPIPTLTLPRTRAELRVSGAVGPWKWMPGETFGVAGADALVSAGGGGLWTHLSIVVADGACSPRGTSLDIATAQALFPPEVTPTLDPEPDRWRASACIPGTRSARVSVVGPRPPVLNEASTSHVLDVVTTIVRAYGVPAREISSAVPIEEHPHRPPLGVVDVDGNEYVPHTRTPPRGPVRLLSGLGLGALGFDGAMDRRYGGVIGGSGRLFFGGELGVSALVDALLGYGDGEMLGELRLGVGPALRRGTAIVAVNAGASIGSIGPSSSADAFAELALAVTGERGGFVAVTALQAFGRDDGADHTRVEVRAAKGVGGGRGTRPFVTAFLALRYLAFDDAPDTRALLLMVGAGGTDHD